MRGFSRGMRQRLALERALLHARGSCCSTSRSPASTIAPSARVAIGCAGSRPTAPSSCWRRTTSISPTAWSRASRSCATAGCVADEAAGARSARALPQRSWSTPDVFLRTALLVLRKDVAIEVEEPRDPDDDAVLRGVVRAGVRLRVREGRAAPSRTRRPASCGSRSRSPGRSRSAGRSSASATAKRCARCCSRRRRGRRSTSASCSACCAAARRRRSCCWCRWSRCCSRRRSSRGRCCSWRCSLAGTIGFAAVGTLFAAMLVRARTRDVLLPILLYPITIPVIIAGVRGHGGAARVAARRADGDRCGSRSWCASTSCS